MAVNGSTNTYELLRAQKASNWLQRSGVVAARELQGDSPALPRSGWFLEELAGRFVEFTGGPSTATLTLGAKLILEAQRRGELIAWIGNSESIFFPPDFASTGIDLAALPVVRVSNTTDVARAADTLLRSGAFRLIILDRHEGGEFSLSVQSRLTGLAKKHHTALLYLTRKNKRFVSRGSLVSFRGETSKERTDHNCFACELHVVKDKRHASGMTHMEIYHGPNGLC